MEIPFSDGDSITLEVFHSSRYSYARIQYTVLGKELDTGNDQEYWYCKQIVSKAKRK